MNICFFTRYPPASGSDCFSSYWFAKNLGKAGHRVFVISSCWELSESQRVRISQDEMAQLEPNNVELFCSTRTVPSKIKRKHINLIDRLVNIALSVNETTSFDLILCGNFYPYGTAGFYTRLVLKKPLIISNRGTALFRLIRSPIIGTLIREIVGKADKVEIRERELADFQNLGVPGARISFIEDVPNPDYFNPDIEPFDFSPYTGKKLIHHPVITSIDLLKPVTKFKVLMDAASMIEERNFFLCFTGSDDRTAMELRQMAASKGLLENIIIIPPYPPWTFPSLMKASRCIVYPGSPENPAVQGRAVSIRYLIEALLCRKCTVISRETYERSVDTNLNDGEHALLFEHNNAGQLCHMLKSLLADPGLAERIGQKAREHALSENEHIAFIKEKMTMFAEVCENFSRSYQEKTL